MKKIEKISDLPQKDEVFLTIGNFDGLHIGHKKIFDEMINDSKGKDTFVITFKNAALEILNPKAFSGYIFPEGYKEIFIKKLNIDYFVLLDFMDVKDIEAANFINILKEKFKKINIYVGEDFKFGRKNRGDVELIKKCVENVKVIPDVLIDGEKVSSSRIRQLIISGNVEKAYKMLSRPYFYISESVRGNGLGSKLGFPTINMVKNNQVLPAYGVYFTIYKFEDKIFPAMTYIGTRPTLNTKELRIETNIINLDKETEKLIKKLKKHCILFIKKTRDEKKFHNLEELKNFLYNDREIILNLYKEIEKTGGFENVYNF